MTDTTNLGLPLIAASQAQKHVTHNEALRILDAAIQIAVLDVTRTAPPAGPVEGQRHIVAASPSGAWTGKAKSIAIWQDGAWAFLVPKAGWCVWCVADGALLIYDGAAWHDPRALPLDNLARLGINATSAAPNLLSVKSNAALFASINVADAGSGDVRVQLSKESAAKTASLVFSDAFSGRAEFGLTGDDDFHVKVSADGTTWIEAIRIARATGKISFPASGGPRETLSANRTYYVRTDSNDANTGLANSAGGGFLTVQKAVDAAASLDIGIFTVTIQIADGTYNGAVVLKNVAGFSAAGACIIQGNATTPANVVIAASGGDAFGGDGISTVWDIKNLKLTTTTSGQGLAARGGATLRFGNVNFGAVAGAHIYADGGGSAVCIAGYAISGGGNYHWQAINGGIIIARQTTVTLTGSPAFSNYFAYVAVVGLVNCFGNTFTGSATGSRYSVFGNAVVFTNGAGASYLPGDSAGTTASGGQYI